MNHNINILNKIADLCGDMEIFYSINIWKYEIRLQGNNLDIALPQFVWMPDDGHKDFVVHKCIIKFESIEIVLISVLDDSNTIHNEVQD
jgi:hypothetical protein